MTQESPYVRPFMLHLVSIYVLLTIYFPYSTFFQHFANFRSSTFLPLPCHFFSIPCFLFIDFDCLIVRCNSHGWRSRCVKSIGGCLRKNIFLHRCSTLPQFSLIHPRNRSLYWLRVLEMDR